MARWAWFWGMWTASLAGLAVVAELLKLLFGAILR